MTIALEISYSQLAVFVAHLANPFNDWTHQHVIQGFSWRPGSVSFGTLDEAGTMNVEIGTTTRFDESTSSACRVIRVPFTVLEDGVVEVASIGSSTTLQLEPGEYELTFEHGRAPDGTMWAKLHFHRVNEPGKAEVLRADADLEPSETLVMTAKPAGER